jgi:hypothetical protein
MRPNSESTLDCKSVFLIGDPTPIISFKLEFFQSFLKVISQLITQCLR